MRLLAQWQEIQRNLPPDWDEARMLLRLVDDEQARRASALLAPLLAARHGAEVRLFVGRRVGPAGDAARRLFGRLDREGLRGQLELTAATEQSVRQPAGVQTEDALTADAGANGPVPGEEPLVAQWDAAIAELPPDWSDLVAELELVSSDQLERAALLMAPANPLRLGARSAFRFRAARRFGYGVAAGMARRCLERIDDEGISGTFRVHWALSDTRPAQTQGPVWYVGGRAT